MMVVEKRVLMKVVFPRPDSPATCRVFVRSWPLLGGEGGRGDAYHDGEGSTALGDNLVPVLTLGWTHAWLVAARYLWLGSWVGTGLAWHADGSGRGGEESGSGSVRTLAMPIGDADSAMGADSRAGGRGARVDVKLVVED